MGFRHLYPERRRWPDAEPEATPTILQMLLPVLLVLPNALYALWPLRHVRRTHARPAD